MNEKINIRELSSSLSEKMNITKKDAEIFLRELFHTVSEGLMQDEIVKIKELGTFKITEVSARESVNVRTGERVVIPAHRKVSYAPDKKLAERINAPYEHLETTEVADNFPVNSETATTKAERETPEDERKTEETAVIKQEPEKVTKEEISQPKIEIPEKPEPEEEKQEEVQEITELEQPVKQEINPSQQILDATPQKFDIKPIYQKKHFVIEYPFLTMFICIFIGLAIFWGIRYFINRSNYQEYRNTLMELGSVPLRVRTLPPLEQDSLKQDSVYTNDLQTQTPSTIDSVETISQDTSNLVQKVRVKAGERLTTISLQVYGSKVFWVYLYEANKNVIPDPNNVKPGTEIIIPDPKMYNIDKKNPKSIQIAADLAVDILEKK